jgi:prevent-host-death family protein
MKWSLSEAKNKLSEVLARAARSPQTIRRRKDDFVVLPKRRYDELVGGRLTFKAWLLDGPRTDDLELPRRSDSPMRKAAP